MRCIDVHTHLGDVCSPYTASSPKGPSGPPSNLLENLGYPSILMKAVASRWFPKGSLLKYCRQAAAHATPENLLKSMAKADIATSFVLPIAPAVSAEQVLAQCARNPNLVPLLSIDFTKVKSSGIEGNIRELLTGYPYKGIKFHPNIQRIDPQSDEALALYEAAAKLNLFVMMHVGRTPFLPCPQQELALLENVLDIPRRFAQTRFVFCHMAKYFESTTAGYEQLGQYANVWFDTSGVAKWLIVEGLRRLGPNRILFGSDWPYGDSGKALATLRQAIRVYADSAKKNFDEVLKQVMYENAQELLKIPALVSP